MNPSPTADLYLRSSRVLTPQGIWEGAVRIRSGRIDALIAPDECPADATVEDLGDAVLMPGLVDSHVHVNEPGRTEWEGFETATRAAAAGGITLIADMPLNSTPVTTTPMALYQKIQAAKRKSWVDCAFFGGLVPASTTEDIEGLIELGVMGFKCFLTHSGIDDFPDVSEADLRQALPLLAKAGVPLLAHAEIAAAAPNGGDPRAYATYLASRPPDWELAAIRLLIDLCRETGARVHIVHLSAADALPLIAAARDEGLPLTVETCPHYLVFAAEDVPAGATQYKCAPPIRAAENRERLWQGLAAGIIDFVVSDHSPCVPELKKLDTGDFSAAWGGIAGLQFGLPAVWTEARRRGHAPAQLLQWMSHAPARFLGLDDRKGAIAVGHDADLVAWDPDGVFQVDEAIVRHRHKLTPYAGLNLQGVVRATWVRGRRVYGGGAYADAPPGRVLLRDPQPPEGG